MKKEHIFLMLQVLEGYPTETPKKTLHEDFFSDAILPWNREILVSCCHVNSSGMCDGGLDIPPIFIGNNCIETRTMMETILAFTYAQALAEKEKKKVVRVIPINDKWEKCFNGELVRIFSCVMQSI